MANSFDRCGVCTSRHVSKLSVVWCQDCDEGLCQDCIEQHSLSKSSRNHKTVPIDEYHKLPPFIANINLQCDEHDEKYLLFCKDHTEVLCRKCVISEKHRECKEISPLEDVIQNAKTSVKLTEIDSSLQELKENLRLILEDRQMNISSLSASKKKLESEISAIREQINNHLDKIQDNCIAEIDKTVENSIQQIQSFLPSVTKKQKEIDDCIDDIESIKTHATDMQTFLGFKQLEIKLKQTENNILSWVNGDSLSEVMVSYKFNTLLQHISKEIIAFGKPVVDVNPCKLSLKRRKEGQAQLMKVNVYPKRSLEHMTLELKAKIKTEANDVSGCCTLPCGKFVISNYNPSYLIICSADGKVEKTITNIVYAIHDVTCVDNETVAVISSSKKDIILVSLISGKESRIIYTSSPSHGLIYFAGNFIVCLTSGKLQRVNMQGVQDNQTNYNPSAVGLIYVSAYRNDTLYSIEKKTSNKIVCHNKKGNVLWKFTDEKALERPQSITVDEHGISFVAINGSNKVIAIAADGEKHKILLSEKDLRGSPWAIDYNSNLKSLLVANEKGGQAFLFTVSYK